MRCSDETFIPSLCGTDAIREFDSSHEIRRDPVVAWRVRRGRLHAEPVTAAIGERHIAIEYPDGTVMTLVEIGHPRQRDIGTLFSDVDEWFEVVREHWNEFGAP